MHETRSSGNMHGTDRRRGQSGAYWRRVMKVSTAETMGRSSSTNRDSKHRNRGLGRSPAEVESDTSRCAISLAAADSGRAAWRTGWRSVGGGVVPVSVRHVTQNSPAPSLEVGTEDSGVLGECVGRICICARARRWIRGRQLACLRLLLGEDSGWSCRSTAGRRVPVRPSAMAVEVVAGSEPGIFSHRLPIGADHKPLGPRWPAWAQALKNMSRGRINGVGHKRGFMREQPVLSQPTGRSRYGFHMLSGPFLRFDASEGNAAQFSRCKVWFIHEAAHMQLLVDPGSHMSSNCGRRPFSPTDFCVRTSWN